MTKITVAQITLTSGNCGKSNLEQRRPIIQARITSFLSMLTLCKSIFSRQVLVSWNCVQPKCTLCDTRVRKATPHFKFPFHLKQTKKIFLPYSHKLYDECHCNT